MAEYILKNPDYLPDSKMNEFKQIHNTHLYSEFQILSLKRRNYLDLEDILTLKKYRVYDKLGSSNSQNKGLLRVRIASVKDKWYIVGSNPIFIPVVYTERIKKIIRKEKFMHFSAKDTAELLIKHNEKPITPPYILSAKELKINLLNLKRYIRKLLKSIRQRCHIAKYQEKYTMKIG